MMSIRQYRHMKRRLRAYLNDEISKEDISPQERQFFQKHIRRTAQRIYWQTRLRSKVVMLLRSITIKPINYMKKPMPVDWHPEYGDTEFPFCPVCDEYAYKKTHCIFCGRRFIWKDGT